MSDPPPNKPYSTTHHQTKVICIKEFNQRHFRVYPHSRPNAQLNNPRPWNRGRVNPNTFWKPFWSFQMVVPRLFSLYYNRIRRLVLNATTPSQNSKRTFDHRPAQKELQPCQLGVNTDVETDKIPLTSFSPKEKTGTKSAPSLTASLINPSLFFKVKSFVPG